MREKKILQKIVHPNIIQLIGTFQDDDSLFFILEYANHGDLCGLIKAMGKTNHTGKLPLEAIRFYAAQIVVALEHLHTNGIVHRDLKPQNIMIGDNFSAKLIDFGDSLIEGESDKNIDDEEENTLFVLYIPLNYFR